MKKKNHWYVVINGWMQGLFDSWEDCKRQVYGYKGALFKGFTYIDDAYEYILDNWEGGDQYVISNNNHIEHFNDLDSFIEAFEEMLD